MTVNDLISTRHKSNESNIAGNRLVAELREKTTHKILRGRVFKVLSSTGASERLIESAPELVDVLATEFHLDVPQVASLWPRIVERHEQISKA